MDACVTTTLLNPGHIFVMDDKLRPLNSKSAPGFGTSGILTPWSERLRLRRDPSPLEAPVEVVFLCDLPGFNGPWLTQYAHAIARKSGPVAILHVDADRLEIQRVSGSDPAHADAKSGPSLGLTTLGPSTINIEFIASRE